MQVPNWIFTPADGDQVGWAPAGEGRAHVATGLRWATWDGVRLVTDWDDVD